MMNIYNNPAKEQWQSILQRPNTNDIAIKETVKEIVLSVQKDGDAALQYYASKLDNYTDTTFLVNPQEIKEAIQQVPEDLKKAIQIAKENITKFHQAQVIEEAPITIMEGITCWRKSKPISKVGLYIPGGTAPLFSTVLMLAIPATLAGCKEIVLCTPVKNNEAVHPAILYAAQLCGINKIYKIGGAVAIAAMAYGTTTISKVYKIFGPGNAYVTAAKQFVQEQGVAIDMPAGPSEVCVMADATAIPEFVAADLLSQAEHGMDSQVLLVCTKDFSIEALQNALTKQVADLPRKDICTKVLEQSSIVVVDTIMEAVDIINDYAPEHLIISCANAHSIADEIENAGSIFLGNYSPESVGDYASGTNHTLPTNGYAKQYSGVSVDSFMKKITYQQLSKKGLESIATTVVSMAEAELLQAHSNAVKIRIKK
jgi:histidinol dehydrogenase